MEGLKYYFQLQHRRFERFLQSLGISSIIGYLGIVFLWWMGSLLVFHKLGHYAAYVYAFLALLLVNNFNEKQRLDFLKINLRTAVYKRIRVIENAITLLPFLGFLIFKQAYIIAIILLVIGIIVALFSFSSFEYRAFPTPFYKMPFELPAGSRKSIFVFPFSLFLVIQAIFVGNFNLGLAAIILLIITVCTYYSKPEPEYYTWIYTFTPARFLIYKISTALLGLLILIAPFSILLIWYFSAKWFVIVGVYLFSSFFLSALILVKYTAYPYDINVAQTLFLSLTIVFPPLLCLLIPYFYKKAIRQVQVFLS